MHPEVLEITHRAHTPVAATRCKLKCPLARAGCARGLGGAINTNGFMWRLAMHNLSDL